LAGVKTVINKKEVNNPARIFSREGMIKGSGLYSCRKVINVVRQE